MKSIKLINIFIIIFECVAIILIPISFFKVKGQQIIAIIGYASSIIGSILVLIKVYLEKKVKSENKDFPSIRWHDKILWYNNIECSKEIQRSMEKDNQNDLQNQETKEKGIIFVRIAMFSLLISAKCIIGSTIFRLPWGA